MYSVVGEMVAKGEGVVKKRVCRGLGFQFVTVQADLSGLLKSKLENGGNLTGRSREAE